VNKDYVTESITRQQKAPSLASVGSTCDLNLKIPGEASPNSVCRKCASESLLYQAGLYLLPDDIPLFLNEHAASFLNLPPFPSHRQITGNRILLLVVDAPLPPTADPTAERNKLLIKALRLVALKRTGLCRRASAALSLYRLNLLLCLSSLNSQSWVLSNSLSNSQASTTIFRLVLFQKTASKSFLTVTFLVFFYFCIVFAIRSEMIGNCCVIIIILQCLIHE